MMKSFLLFLSFISSTTHAWSSVIVGSSVSGFAGAVLLTAASQPRRQQWRILQVYLINVTRPLLLALRLPTTQHPLL